EVVIWEMNGAAIIGSGSLGNPGAAWHAQGLPASWPPARDFNGDGYSDILFQNVSGEADIWAISGSAVLVSVSLGNPGASWHSIATGDFNGDGNSDILFQNDSGEAAIWEMDGATVIAAASLGNPGASWHVKGAGDFNGDGRSDILWQ